MGLLGAFLVLCIAVLEECWAIMADFRDLLGRVGSRGEPQDGVMAAQ